MAEPKMTVTIREVPVKELPPIPRHIDYIKKPSGSGGGGSGLSALYPGGVYCNSYGCQSFAPGSPIPPGYVPGSWTGGGGGGGGGGTPESTTPEIPSGTGGGTTPTTTPTIEPPKEEPPKIRTFISSTEGWKPSRYDPSTDVVVYTKKGKTTGFTSFGEVAGLGGISVGGMYLGKGGDIVYGRDLIGFEYTKQPTTTSINLPLLIQAPSFYKQETMGNNRQEFIEVPTSMPISVVSKFEEPKGLEGWGYQLRRKSQSLEGKGTLAGLGAAGLGVASVGVGYLSFGKSLVTKPITTLEGIPSGLKGQVEFYTSGEFSKQLSQEPGFTSGQIIGEGAAFKGTQYLGLKAPEFAKAQTFKFFPESKFVKGLKYERTIPGISGEQGITLELVEKGKVPTLSRGIKQEILQSDIKAVATAQTGLFPRFKKEIPLDRELFVSPPSIRGEPTLRVSRFQETSVAKISDIFEGNIQFGGVGRRQVPIFEKPKGLEITPSTEAEFIFSPKRFGTIQRGETLGRVAISRYPVSPESTGIKFVFEKGREFFTQKPVTIFEAKAISRVEIAEPLGLPRTTFGKQSFSSSIVFRQPTISLSGLGLQVSKLSYGISRQSSISKILGTSIISKTSKTRQLKSIIGYTPRMTFGSPFSKQFRQKEIYPSQLPFQKISGLPKRRVSEKFFDISPLGMPMKPIKVKGKRKYQRMPSLVALELNIREPRQRAGEISGLQFRPILTTKRRRRK